jgi:hypothetical protein
MKVRLPTASPAPRPRRGIPAHVAVPIATSSAPVTVSIPPAAAIVIQTVLRLSILSPAFRTSSTCPGTTYANDAFTLRPRVASVRSGFHSATGDQMDPFRITRLSLF